MANKKNSQPPKNDFEYNEGEVSGFTENAPIIGDCIASFSFVDGCIIETTKPNLESQSNDNATTLNNKTITENKNASINNLNIQTNTTDPIETKSISSPAKDIFDNRRTPLPNRATPSIDGEIPTIKRTYTLRDSTIRKINELKNVHPDINVCVSSIVDIALDYYHNYILNEGGTQ